MYILLPSDIILGNCHLSSSVSTHDLSGKVPTPLQGTDGPWRSGPSQLLCPVPYHFLFALHSVGSHTSEFVPAVPSPRVPFHPSLLNLSFSNDHIED